MYDDRKPATAVSVDEDAKAEEFEVDLKRHEVMAIIEAFSGLRVDISHCRDVEPWFRVVDADGQLLTYAGVSVIPDED
jgi:hypothetical protein